MFVDTLAFTGHELHAIGVIAMAKQIIPLRTLQPTQVVQYLFRRRNPQRKHSGNKPLLFDPVCNLYRQHSVNSANLVSLRISPATPHDAPFVNVALLNARHVCNNTSQINEYLVEHKWDVLAITETWLMKMGDEAVIAEVTPRYPGFVFQQVARSSRRRRRRLSSPILQTPHSRMPLCLVLKQVIVWPLLKKQSLNNDILNNYRPVSNLIKKASFPRSSRELSREGSYNYYFRSAIGGLLPISLPKKHPTETALLYVANALKAAIDKIRHLFSLTLARSLIQSTTR